MFLLSHVLEFIELSCSGGDIIFKILLNGICGQTSTPPKYEPDDRPKKRQYQSLLNVLVKQSFLYGLLKGIRMRCYLLTQKKQLHYSSSTQHEWQVPKTRNLGHIAQFTGSSTDWKVFQVAQLV